MILVVVLNKYRRITKYRSSDSCIDVTLEVKKQSFQGTLNTDQDEASKKAVTMVCSSCSLCL